MPLSETEKRRISKSQSLEALLTEYQAITKSIQLEGLRKGEEAKLISELKRLTEKRRQELAGNVDITRQARETNKNTPNKRRHFTNHDFRRFNELIFGENQSVALQIYHPTTSHLHSDADKRILSLKDGKDSARNLYAEAIAQVLPSNHIVYLACVPPSSPYGGQSLKNLIKKVVEKSNLFKDISSILRTTEPRGKKSHGHRFSDEALSATISVDPITIQQEGVIILIDDVVTTGQSFRVCTKKLRESGIENDILFLAMARTERNVSAEGIADKVFKEQLATANSTHIPRTRQPQSPPSVPRSHRKEKVLQPTSNKPKSQITEPAHYAKNSYNQKVSASKNDCFVITAIYEGDYNHSNVKRLRKWRDEKLGRSPSGQILISIYYKAGPVLARSVKHLRLTKTLRLVLEMFIGKGS